MRELVIHSIKSCDILEQLKVHLDGELIEQWGEIVLNFNNKFGKGQIRCIEFDFGVSLMDYDVHFLEDTKIIFDSKEAQPIEFIFVSEGSMKYYCEAENREYNFEPFQNIIVSNDNNSTGVYIFPEKVSVKVNFIYVLRKKYAKKKNNNLSYLNEKLLATFKDEEVTNVYKHFGNFNLKIADKIRQLNESYESGIVRTLSLEGQLNLIMAMQILEHSNYEEGKGVPDSMSKEDIKKIHELSGYIIDNISESLTIASLSERSGLSPKKLQLGFSVLDSKSVNEYVRQMKLEVSRDYIKNSNKSISEIVYNIGFKSRSYFSKIFFEKYGILPVDYRKKINSVKK